MTQLGSNAQLGSNVQMGMDPGFNPLWLSGCVAWFDMQDPMTFSTNSSLRVLSILNKASGVAWTEASNGPFFDPVGFGGAFPTMQCNGANRIISTEAAVVAAMVNSPALTVMAAIQSDAPDASVSFFGAANSGQATNSSRGWGTNTLGNGNWLANAANDAGTAVSVSSAASTDNANPNIYEYFTDGSVSSIVVNGGTPDPNATAQAIGTLTPNRVAIGCAPRSTPNAYWTGKVSEVLIFNRTLTDFERAVVRTYLLRKWGIADPSPLTILGSLAWWVRADSGVTIATGVSGWADMSGNGVNFSQGATNFQPAYTSNAINGLPAVTGDGSNDAISATWARSAPGTQPFFIWQIACPLTWGANKSFIGDYVSSTGFIVRQTVSSPQVTQYCNADRNANGGGPVGTWSRYESYFANTTGDYQKIGTTTTTGQNAGNMAGGGTVTFFARGDGNGFGNISTAEAFAFLGTPTTAQRAWLDAYAYLRYGPTLNVG